MNQRRDAELPWAVTWTVEREPMQRSWHALEDGGRVWLVDPIDDPEHVDDALARGELAGVIQLLDRHERGCRALADRHGVPLHRLPESLPGTPFEPFRVIWRPKWRELGLWWPARRTLVVPESIGTGDYFALGGSRAGIHPLVRARPPRTFVRGGAEHLLTGHGPALHGAAAEAVERALAESRRHIPRVALGALRSTLRR